MPDEGNAFGVNTNEGAVWNAAVEGNTAAGVPGTSVQDDVSVFICSLIGDVMTCISVGFTVTGFGTYPTGEVAP